MRRFIRLTELIPEILDMVDEKKISMTPAVELSYLEAGGTAELPGGDGLRPGRTPLCRRPSA